MRYKLVLLILLQILMVSATLRSTDLRGGVAGYNPYTQTPGPLPGVAIGLFVQAPNGTFAVVRQAVTGPDGRYYLAGVYPGQYVLQVAGVNYPLAVGATPMQDIPIIYR